MLANGQQLAAIVRSAISILDAATSSVALEATATPAHNSPRPERPAERQQAPSPDRPGSNGAH
eukprot:396485-Heterocapsa_arctica.AAC.1